MNPAEVYCEQFAGEPYSFWFDDWGGKTWLGCGSPAEYDGSGPFAGWITYEGEARLIRIERLVRMDAAAPRVSEPLKTRSRIERLALFRCEYLHRIEQCLEWIRDGETYEICLTNQIHLATDADPLSYFRRLRTVNRAPYSAFLKFGDVQVACSSPECFLRIDRRLVESRPIKGTLPSNRDPAELISSERFRAENLMIVDLVRNDLSRVCEPGTVEVPDLMKVETYPTVHQLVSTIRGRLTPDTSTMDCVRAAFPGGSMTGAPKIRTMELLRRLEPEPRGIYSGTLGYFDLEGASELAMVIRTAIFHERQVTIGVGGAIVADSDPAAEWEETMLKAKALLDVFDPALRQDERLL